MTVEERTECLSEAFDAMEAGEATVDDWWDTVFPKAADPRPNKFPH